MDVLMSIQISVQECCNEAVSGDSPQFSRYLCHKQRRQRVTRLRAVLQLHAVLELRAMAPSDRPFSMLRLRINGCWLLLEFCHGSCLTVAFAPLNLRQMHIPTPTPPIKATWLFSFCLLHKVFCMRSFVCHFREQQPCSEHQQKTLLFL